MHPNEDAASSVVHSVVVFVVAAEVVVGEGDSLPSLALLSQSGPTIRCASIPFGASVVEALGYSIVVNIVQA